jgi:hypothetical protein
VAQQQGATTPDYGHGLSILGQVTSNESLDLNILFLVVNEAKKSLISVHNPHNLSSVRFFWDLD